MKPDIETLVALVVNRAVVDKTAPDFANLRNGWRTDALFQDIDAFVVVQCNDPASYAEIGRQVLAKVQDLPEIAALAWLAIFRGERLLPIDFECEQMLAKMAEELQRIVFALPDSTRRMRCKSLLEYHAGVFFDACGRFDLAAKMFTQSAEEAQRLGDGPGAAIGRFCTVACNLKDVLHRGRMDEADMLFSAMKREYVQVDEATQGTALQVQWAEGNCPSHMIEACVWLDQVHPEWKNWVETTLAASDKLGGAFVLGADFVRAMDMAMRDDPKADEALKGIVNGDNANQTKATALLLLARRAMRAGKRDVAEDIVRRIPEQGAQHVCAIVRRMLASK